MVPLDKIRSDLKEIRYYYSRKAMFDECKNVVIGSSITEKVRRYNEAVKSAPPQLYDLYMMLYVKAIRRKALPLNSITRPCISRCSTRNCCCFCRRTLRSEEKKS